MMTAPRLLIVWLFLFVANIGFAQPVLGPAINDGSLPDDDGLICDIPLELDILEVDGPQETDLVKDFTLYDTEGNMMHLQDEMADGKPVLLIGASYSCMVFRTKVDLINSIYALLSDSYHIYIVYTVEAHPYGDISPYYGIEATGEENFAADILIPQSDTYGERKSYATEMKTELEILPPVLIDGLCNEWWQEYGSSPNNAFVIDTDGLVYDKQIWLDRYPEDIYAAMYGLLGIDIDGTPLPTGVFSLLSYDDTCVNGDPGSTIIAHANFNNADTVASYVEVINIAEAIPDGWETSLCTDICYGPTENIVNMLIDPASDQGMSVYFYTNLNGTTGQVNLLLKNVYVPANSYELNLKVCTASTEVNELDIFSKPFYVYPNPATETANAFLAAYSDGSVLADIFDLKGHLVFSNSYDTPLPGTTIELDIHSLEPGYYFMRISGETMVSISPFVVQ
jgi:hypothetical protein